MMIPSLGCGLFLAFGRCGAATHRNRILNVAGAKIDRRALGASALRKILTSTALRIMFMV
jgi:hypothetical protein